MACKLKHTHAYAYAHTYITQPRLSKVDSAVLFIKANSQHHIHTFVDRIFITKQKKSGYYCRLRSNLCLYVLCVRTLCNKTLGDVYVQELTILYFFFLCHCHPIVCCTYCKQKIFLTSTKIRRFILECWHILNPQSASVYYVNSGCKCTLNQLH